MIYSMTGFSAVTAELDNGSLAVEIRSVNHRYLDIQLRMPDELRSLEPVMREMISAQANRGKIECRINYLAKTTADAAARLNPAVLQQLSQWNQQVRKALPAARDLSVAEILHWNGIFESNAPSREKLHASLLQLFQQAIVEFVASRNREGEKLKSFLLQRTEQINAFRVQVAPRIPDTIKAYEIKLRSRLLEALGAHDDERLHQEISLFASKIDVDEELSRLHTHLTEIERVLAKGGSMGKRLDLMMQELHREANTLGAKSADTEVSRASLEMKILIEQMRDQIHNIE